MSGVSCRVLIAVLDGAGAEGLSTSRLLRDVNVSMTTLRDPDARIPWNEMVQILENLSRDLGGPEKLREFGARQFAHDTLSLQRRIGRLLSHPRDLYWMGAHWLGPSLFPMTDAQIWELDEHRVVQRLTIHPNHRPSPEFFHLMHGVLSVAPSSMGHGSSDVSLRIDGHRATFIITMSSSGKGWLGKLIRTVSTPFTIPGMLRELTHQQVAIEETYSEIKTAKERIELQAAELEQVNAIGRRLAEHITLDQVADVLIDVVLRDIGARGVELWLVRPTASANPDDVEARFFRGGGVQDGPPDAVEVLETASRPLGHLKVWEDRRSEEPVNGDLLGRLLPWIAMTIDNARSYDALETHAEDLEERVTERTNRLVAANHHLVKEIGERRRATEALLESETQLRAAERLASIGTLAAGIAHEINNPVGSILAAAQLAQVVQETDEQGREEEVAAALEDIIQQAKRCGGIVRSVLQFSRDERTEKWDCRLSDVISRAIRLTEAFATASDVEVELEPIGLSPWVHANPIQIEQAIVNLVRNAIESGGRVIRVRLDEVSSDDEDVSRARISIEDDGPGIPEEERARIFEPFFTTKRNDGGTGLGLSVVHGIAVEHHGELLIEAREGGGTMAVLELPTVPGPLGPLSDDPLGKKPLDRS